jgi:hypothetical protein
LIEVLDDLRAKHGGQRTCLLKSHTWSSSGELTHEEPVANVDLAGDCVVISGA